MIVTVPSASTGQTGLRLSRLARFFTAVCRVLAAILWWLAQPPPRHQPG
jgi:hypothetical protein